MKSCACWALASNMGFFSQHPTQKCTHVEAMEDIPAVIMASRGAGGSSQLGHLLRWVMQAAHFVSSPCLCLPPWSESSGFKLPLAISVHGPARVTQSRASRCYCNIAVLTVCHRRSESWVRACILLRICLLPASSHLGHIWHQEVSFH